VAYQSLYRRFRPQRFSEVRGQEHVTAALRNAVAHGTVAHAYLFSGPRGTGKTSTARILAKALNCAAPADGEPCGACPSCEQVTAGTSLDVHELDAASHSGVEAMRELVARASLGTPGRWKVYIVDEVHMLSTAAANAMLKTLEEPPGHVVFVLATTDPQKVLPTIRSRTQHFEFRLLAPEVLTALVREVVEQAGLALGDDAVSAVVRRGRGSARDALSALDQVAAAGGLGPDTAGVSEVAEALAERDPGRALVAVGEALQAGLEPRRLLAELLAHLRDGFLATMAPSLVDAASAERAAAQARRLGPAALVRAIEVLGQAELEMRDALDPRITLEVALVRLAHPEADDTTAALAERLERLERRLAEREHARSDEAAPAPPRRVPEAPAPPRRVPEAPAPPRRVPEAPGPSAEPSRPPRDGVDAARAALGAYRRARGTASPPGGGGGHAAQRRDEDDPEAPSPPGDPARDASLPSRDELVTAWGDTVLRSLSGRARALYAAGRFLAVEDGAAVFALPTEVHRTHCEGCRADVEAALSAHFGTAVPLRLVVDPGPPPIGDHDPFGAADPFEDLDPTAPADPEPTRSVVERLLSVFPGATELPAQGPASS
jgi:DNA polymerase-3 subunit gamma/tau